VFSVVALLPALFLKDPMLETQAPGERRLRPAHA
jgi:hypothetical protein